VERRPDAGALVAAGDGIAGYIAAWRPSSVPAAAFARQVVTAAAPGGRERAKGLLSAAGKLAGGWAIPLGMEPAPASPGGTGSGMSEQEESCDEALDRLLYIGIFFKLFLRIKAAVIEPDALPGPRSLAAAALTVPALGGVARRR
jgi:hypothetical protein